MASYNETATSASDFEEEHSNPNFSTIGESTNSLHSFIQETDDDSDEEVINDSYEENKTSNVNRTLSGDKFTDDEEIIEDSSEENDIEIKEKDKSTKNEDLLEISHEREVQSLSKSYSNKETTEDSFQENTSIEIPATDAFLKRRKAMIELFISSDEEEEKTDDKVSICSNSSDIIVSSDEEESISPVKKLNQSTLDKFVSVASISSESPIVQQISRTDYVSQVEKIKTMENEILLLKRAMLSANMQKLEDKGAAIRNKFKSLTDSLVLAREKLKLMIVSEENIPKTGIEAVKAKWQNVQAGLATVQPKTFGKKGLENHNVQKALTEDALNELHGSLENCPKDNELAEDPHGLKVSLLLHQKQALAWLIYRENKKPAGGILADDMGLGKTLSILSLIVKRKDDAVNHESTDSTKYRGKSLVVCPVSLIGQWSNEIETKLKRGLLSYNIYHGPKRESKARNLTAYDVVITTYSTALSEYTKEGPLFRVRWNRIILDEAHTIRNHKSQTSIAMFALSGNIRWALTGTPVHNKELDIYALLKFLRCTPFDDLAVYKRWVSDKSTGGGERLQTVISSLMLRRTKSELIENGNLKGMPSKTWEEVSINLSKAEFQLYQKILIFSQTLFAEYLHQQAEKNQEAHDLMYQTNAEPNGEYIKMRQKLLKLNKMKQINTHEILVLLLRLRQVCCHPSLITGMLQGDEDLGDDENGRSQELDLLNQLNQLKLDDNTEESFSDVNTTKLSLEEATKGLFNPSNPIFDPNWISSKTNMVLQLLENVLEKNEKVLIISQWRSHLEIIGNQLKMRKIKFKQFDGTVPTTERARIVEKFNDPTSRYKVLLLSLTAGGVGLNLMGANHLFLIDLHWNPQLESQAQDRIYRVGQKKSVFVHKFVTNNTIEERIKRLQQKKLEVAENLLTGSKQVVANKLSLNDLKMLFNL